MGMRRALAFALLCAGFIAPPAHAGLTLNAGYQQEQEREIEGRETELPAAGYSAGLCFDLGTSAWLGIGYSSTRTAEFEDAIDGVEGRLEYRSWSPALGLAWPWTNKLGITGTGGYSFGSTRGLDGFANDSVERYQGPTGSLALWWAPASWLSFNAGRGYSYVGSVPGWDNSAGLGLRLWRELWLDGAYWRGEAADGWTAGLRLWIDG